MPHMPAGTQPIAIVGSSSGLPVEYTATGIEGTSFLCPIGQTVNTTTYKVVYSPQGVTNAPIVDLPQGVGDRTTTYFRVNLADVLAAGEKLLFVLFGA